MAGKPGNNGLKPWFANQPHQRIYEHVNPDFNLTVVIRWRRILGLRSIRELGWDHPVNNPDFNFILVIWFWRIRNVYPVENMAIEELSYMEKSVIELEQDCDRMIAQIIKVKKVVKRMATSGRAEGMTWLKDQMKYVMDEVDRMVGE
jgi:hypothetical protein